MSVTSSFRRHIDPVSQQPCGWKSLLPQLIRSSEYQNNNTHRIETPWDIGCKNTLHSSSRTFDIQQGPDKSSLPEIVSLVDGGIFLRVANSKPQAWREQNYMGADWRKNTFFAPQQGSTSLRFSPPNSNGDIGIGCLISRQYQTIRTFHFSSASWRNSRHIDVNNSLLSDSNYINDIAFHPSYGKDSA
eukprot:CAMPEP_0194198194 /NCGR_PEP_ID=MMETSP0154-20130528/77631_1 /TAXON_ID=1049557 /ORGANISM="Thalassiothrix antarctica, Strain L6-D1" /LENGTH=187 /DNA_ID=CAMNT_0038922959 /DNA_START=248 /DNA_END=808 /DNA_ORIENTATION=+